MDAALAKRDRTGLKKVGLGAAGAIVLILIVAQIVLPIVAADRMRSRVARYGRLTSVSVSAWPALELLWGKAQSATARAQSVSISPAQVAELLWEGDGIDRFDASARSVVLDGVPALAGGLGMSDGVLSKRGSRVRGQADFTQSQLDAAMPAGVKVVPLGSDAEGVHIKASGSLFGLQASIGALVTVREGRVLAVPEDIPFGALASVTLFSDAHLKVRSLSVTVLGTQPRLYRLSLEATLA